MDALTFVKTKNQQKRKYPTLRIDDTMFSVVSKISKQTGLSKSTVATRMIAFAAAHTTVDDCCAKQKNACCLACQKQ